MKPWPYAYSLAILLCLIIFAPFPVAVLFFAGIVFLSGRPYEGMVLFLVADILYGASGTRFGDGTFVLVLGSLVVGVAAYWARSAFRRPSLL